MLFNISYSQQLIRLTNCQLALAADLETDEALVPA